ncbi:MAG: zinc-ribbon domain-containing protein [Candidatus Bathyarchaeia archaeon]|jgi:uncharacterized membrane protein YvbJ
MTFCSHCGKQLSDEALFCPNCGTKTPKGVKENAKYPTDEIKEAFSQAGVEIEKAFHIAAREMHKAFQDIKEDFHNTSSNNNQPAAAPTVTCKNCGAINQPDAIFCRNCGNKIAA